MSSIDERIVEMQFNNKQFESGTKESMASLEALKKTISGMGTDSSAFNALSSNVQSLADRFSSMGIVAMTVLQNITNAAINTGMQMLKAINVTPLIDGFREYELQMQAVKVMMANLGDEANMTSINAALDDLNAYADLTIYNFGNMTEAVGKFTAGGVGLEDSVNAIKGLSNIAAGAGVPAYKMANAYTQVSQAIQAGVFRLQDWNSLQNAGLANEEFRNRLLATAADLDGYTLGSSTFRESLKDNWLTTEVFLTTMAQAADETDDWGKRLYAAATEITTFSQMVGTVQEALGTTWGDSLKMIIGDFEKAKELWTSVYAVLEDLILASGNARNEMLKIWQQGGGRVLVIESFANIFKALVEVMKPVKEAWDEIFPPMTGEKLLRLSQQLFALTEQFKLSDEAAANIKSTFKGLFAALDLGLMAVSAVIDVIGKLADVFLPTSGSILEFTGNIGDFIVSLRDSALEGNVFGRAVTLIGTKIDEVAEVIRSGVDKVKEAINNLKERFKEFDGIDLSPLTNMVEKVKIRIAPFETIGNIFQAAFNVVIAIFEWAAPLLSSLAGIAGEAIKKLMDTISESIKNNDFKSLIDLLNTGLIGGILLAIKKFIDSLSDITGEASGFLGNLTGILDGVRGSLEAWQSNLKAKTLLTIATALGILAASLVAISLIDSAKLTGALVGISALFVELVGAMGGLKLIMGDAKMAGVAVNMVALSTAVLILASAMSSLGKLKWEEIGKGIIAVGALMGEMLLFVNLVNPTKLLSTGVGLMAVATAVNILTVAVKSLGGMDPAEMLFGLLAVGALLMELMLFTNLIDPVKLLSTGVALIAIGAALNTMVPVVQALGAMDYIQLQTGLLAIGILLLELGTFITLIDPVKLLSTSVAMIAIGAALNIMAVAVQTLGGMDYVQLQTGLLAIGILLLELGTFITLIDPVKLLSTSVAMIAMGAAINIIAVAIGTMGGMGWEEIAKGLITLAGALGIIGIAMYAMTGTAAGAAAMLVMAAAILMLTPALKILGSMGLQEIGTALLALAGVFVIVGAAAFILAPLTPVILALAAGIALLGVAILAIGGGLLLFSTGLAALAVSGTAGAAALVVIITSLLSLIPLALTKIGEGIVAFAGVIATGSSAILAALQVVVDGITQLIVGVIQAIIDMIGPVLEAILPVLTSLLETIVQLVVDAVTQLLELIPVAMEALGEGIVALAGVIADGAPKIIEALKAVLTGLIKLIIELTPQVVDALANMVMSLINKITESVPQMVESGLKMLTGILTGIRDNIGQIVTVALEIIGEFLKGIAEGIPSIVEGAVSIITSFLGAIGEETPKIVDAGFKMVIDLVNGIATSIEENMPELKKAFKNLGSAMISGLTGGLLGGKKEVEGATAEVGNAAISSFKTTVDSHSPSKVFYEEGENIVDGLVDGIEDHSSGVITAGENLANFIKKGFGDEAATADFTRVTLENLAYFKTSLNEQSEGIKTALTNMYAIPSSAEQTEATKKMTAEQKEIYQTAIKEQETSLKELTDVVDAAFDTIESRISSYTDLATDRMSVLSTESEVSITEMISNMEKNQQIIADWADNIALLAERGLNDGLLEQLRQAGPASAGEVKAIVSGTDEQIGKLNDVFLNGGVVATNALVTSIGQGQPVMVAEGQTLTEAIAAGITADTSINSAMSTILATAQQDMAQQAALADFASVGSNLMAGLSEGITNNTTQVVTAMEGMLANVDSTVRTTLGIHSPSTVYAEHGLNLMEGLAQGIANNVSKPLEALTVVFAQMATSITTAAQTVTTAAVIGLKSNEAEYGTIGSKYGLDFSTNLSNQQINSMTAGQMVSLWAEIGIKSNQLMFGQTGLKNGLDFADQLASKATEANLAGIKVASEALKGLVANAADFYAAGAAAAIGFANGILSEIGEVVRAAKKVAAAANEAFEDELDIHSPSRVFYSHGENTGIGYVNGLLSTESTVAETARELGTAAIDSIKDTISTIVDLITADLTDMEPVITPVIDLSKAEQGAYALDQLLSGKGLTTTANRVQAGKVSATLSKDETSAINAPETVSKEGVSYSFVQNNTSPKALNRLEIYRQTRNQFAQLKGLVDEV